MLILIPVSLSAQKDVRKNIRKGNKEYKAQKYSDAASFYEKAIEENPTSNEANYNLGNTLYNQKEWDKAIEFYNNSNSAEGENSVNVSSAMHNIGNAMLRKKELNDAMEAYKMALRLNPEDDETRYNLAVVQKMIQDEEQQQDDGEDDQEQQQEQQQDQQQSPQNQQDQEKRPEQPDSPEQMSRDNARALLQALEQDERETQEKVQQIKAQEREEQAQDNRRQNKNW